MAAARLLTASLATYLLCDFYYDRLFFFLKRKKGSQCQLIPTWRWNV